jgi:hypothetical protein
MWYTMADGFKKTEDKKAADWKRRKKLNDEGSAVKPEPIEKSEFFADEKRGNYVTDNVDETPNVQ